MANSDIFTERLRNVDLDKEVENHVQKALSENFENNRFDDVLGNLHHEKYWDTPDEKILRDIANKISQSIPAILHRSTGSNSVGVDTRNVFSEKELTYEFIIGAMTTLEGTDRPRKVRPVRVIANRIENVMKENPFVLEGRNEFYPFSYSSTRTVFRKTTDSDGTPFGGLDIYLLRMQNKINHV